MAVMIDTDIQKLSQAIDRLTENPSDRLLRQTVSQISARVWFSVMEAANFYDGVLEGLGNNPLKSRRQQIKDEFEKAIQLMSGLNDDYLKAVKSRFREIQRAISEDPLRKLKLPV